MNSYIDIYTNIDIVWLLTSKQVVKAVVITADATASIIITKVKVRHWSWSIVVLKRRVLQFTVTARLLKYTNTRLSLMFRFVATFFSIQRKTNIRLFCFEKKQHLFINFNYNTQLMKISKLLPTLTSTPLLTWDLSCLRRLSFSLTSLDPVFICVSIWPSSSSSLSKLCLTSSRTPAVSGESVYNYNTNSALKKVTA